MTMANSQVLVSPESKKITHARTLSRSTTASSSPTVLPPVGHGKKLQAANKPRTAAQKNRLSSPNKISRPAKRKTAIQSRVQTNASQTPAHNAPLVLNQTKGELYKSPCGTDYIVTPGRHLIRMNDFIAHFDKKADNVCPVIRANSNYSENMFQHWIECEKDIDPRVFLMSFADNSPMETFRLMAIQCVFNYAIEHKLHQNTIHLAILNISRLIHARVIQSKERTLTHELFSCTVIAALRNAIKLEETYHKSDKFRIDPEHVWRSSGFLADYCSDKSAKRLNEVECECLQLIAVPANPPLPPAFLDRYLSVGNWQAHREEYRDLGCFLLAMALFAHGKDNQLRGIPGSRLAASALALAIKIINTDNEHGRWEFWPDRLVKYTGYSVDDLRPGIRGIATLLREKPKAASILAKYYTKWGHYDWQ